MKTLYIECAMGITSSTLFAALFELLEKEKQNDFLNIMNQLFAPDLSFHPEIRKQCNIAGTYMRVRTFGAIEPLSNYKKPLSFSPKMSVEEITTGHIQTRGLNSNSSSSDEKSSSEQEMKEYQNANSIFFSYASILEKIQALPLPEDVRSNAENIFHILSTSEAQVQNSNIEEVNLHESGSLRSLANVVGNCLLLSSLNVEQILVSPIHVGTGTIPTDNGNIPIPRPVTAQILKEIPFYTGNIHYELCSPTGAAIIKQFATGFGSMPTMAVVKSGFGFRLKEFDSPNGVRVFYGETDYFSLYQTNALTDKGEQLFQKDFIIELICTITHMNSDELAFTISILQAAGALDVFYTQVQLKNNCSGVRLHCLCLNEKKKTLTELLFKYTTATAIQYQMLSQTCLDSTIEELHTNYGTIRKKIATGHGIKKSNYEFEDLKNVAENEGVSIQELLQQLSTLHSET